MTGSAQLAHTQRAAGCRGRGDLLQLMLRLCLLIPIYPFNIVTVGKPQTFFSMMKEVVIIIDPEGKSNDDIQWTLLAHC